MSNKRISQLSIAKHAKVSRPVVSAVLSGQTTSIRVSPATRQRVLGAAKRLGYEPRFIHANAMVRPTIKSGTVVWLGYNTGRESSFLQQSLASYYQRLLQSVLEALGQHHLTLQIKQNCNEDRLMEWIIQSGAEGIIWRGGDGRQPLLKTLAERFPVVVINQAVDCNVDIARVSQGQNVRLALNYLYEQGHRRIAYFGHFSRMSRWRKAAYEEFVSEHGLTLYPEFLSLPDDPAIEAVPKACAILDTWTNLGQQRPTALVTSDIFALHIFKEAQQRNISVPADLSLVGIDNLAAGELSHPALTTIHQPLEEVGRIAVELLQQRIKDRTRPTQTVEINPSLVIRQSVATLAG